MLRAITQDKGMVGFIALLALFYLAMGPVSLVFMGSDDWEPSTMERALLGLVPMAAGALMLTGLFVISKRAPWWGAGLLSGGAVLMSVLWFWLFFISIPVTLGVIAFAVFRARRFAREGDQIATA